MEKLKALFDLFRSGEQVANPDIWKTGGNVGAVVTALLLSVFHLLKAFGYDIPIDEQTADQVGAGIAAGGLFILHNITSKKAGLLPAKELPSVAETNQRTIDDTYRG